MRHVLRLHNLIRPLPIHIIHLINLCPRPDTRRLRGIADGAKEHVRDGTRVRGRVPCHLDRVTSLGGDGGHARGHYVAVDVAGNVVAGDVRDGIVARGHADSDLVPGRDAVDPELVEVLVG